MILVVYLAGHGYALSGEDGGDWYLLPWTREWRQRSDSTDEFDDLIRRHGLSAHRLMTLLTQTAAERALHVLAAARAQETAAELQLQPRGALTLLVLEAMKGRADVDRNRNVSVREIIDYATVEMPNLADRLSQEPISQKPVGYSRGADFSLTQLN